MNKAILCVDDELDVLDSLCAALQKAFGNQYEIEKAENALEALEVLEELVMEGLQVVLIITDWLMPGMKGDELLIKVHQKYPDIIKIMLTGEAEEKAIENAKKNAHMAAVIQKPWNYNELIEIIKTNLTG